MTHDERGTITLWVLGLCVCVLFLGGLGVDLWRGIAVRRDLAALADAAATAAANGIDEDALRTGDVHLDPERVRAIALDALSRDSRYEQLEAAAIAVVGDEVVVTLEDDVPLSLLNLFAGNDPFTVRVTARARPAERT
jgi:hypothetical protein